MGKRQATRMDRYRTDYDDYVEGVDEDEVIYDSLNDEDTQEYVSPLVNSYETLNTQRRVQAVRLDDTENVEDGTVDEEVDEIYVPKAIHYRIDTFLNRGIALMIVIILFTWLIAFIF